MIRIICDDYYFNNKNKCYQNNRLNQMEFLIFLHVNNFYDSVKIQFRTRFRKQLGSLIGIQIFNQKS